MARSVYDVTPASRLPRQAEPPPEFRPTASGEVPQAAVEAFGRDGVVCLRGALGMERVEALREGADLSAGRPGPLGYKIGEPGQPGFFYYDFQLHERIEAFRWLVYESPVPCWGARLMGSPGVTLYYSNLFVKDGGSKAASPWHEDASYQRIDGLQCINFWIALDAIPAETTLLFKRGSHLKPDPLYRPRHFDPDGGYGVPLSLGRVDMPPLEEIDRRFETVWWALEPGDAVVFTQRTIHGAPANTLGTRRRAAALLLIGDEATYNADPGESDPPFRDDSLSHGDHPAGDVFLRLI